MIPECPAATWSRLRGAGQLSHRLELTCEKRSYESISDARNVRVISLADQSWFTEEFLPIAMDQNISPKMYSGVIVPHDFNGFGASSIRLRSG